MFKLRLCRSLWEQNGARDIPEATERPSEEEKVGLISRSFCSLTNIHCLTHSGHPARTGVTIAKTYVDVKITHDSFLVLSPLSVTYNNINDKLSKPLI